MVVLNFTGPDGSGKTTITRLLRGYLYSRGIYASISWFRGTHLFSSLLARALFHFSTFKGTDNPYYEISIPPKMKCVWAVVEFLSVLPYYMSRRLLSKLNPVIGDRWVLDFVVWIVVTLNYPKFLRSVIGRFLLRLATGEFTIYVTAELQALIARASEVPRKFLLKELVCYRVLAKYYAMCTVDTTSKRPAEALNEVLECLRKHYSWLGV